MKPLPFVWPYALVFWAVFIWAFIPEFRLIRRAQVAQGPSDARSLQVVAGGQAVAYFLAFWLAWIPALRFSPAYRRGAFVVGVAVMIAGALLRRHCRRTLGASFTGDVRVRPDQQVVDRGAYRIVRHPSYTAALILNAGVGIALGSWGSTLIPVVIAAAVLLHRIGVEERALAATIGDPYREYMRGRKRLIPFIY